MRPADRPDDGAAESAGDVVRLVEAAPPAPERMERHRNDGVGGAQPVVRRLAEHRGKGLGERAAPTVLERVDHRPERPVMQAGGAARGERSTAPPAGATGRGAVALPTEVGRAHRQAATAADGRRETRDLPQAGGADDTARR